MELQAFVSLIRRRWPVVVLAFVVCLAGSAAISESQTKTYTASARLYVNVTGALNTQQLQQGSDLASQLLASFAKMADAKITTNRVSQALNGRIQSGVVPSKVSASQVPQTLLLEIKAHDTNPAFAAVLANQEATSLSTVIEQLGATTTGGVKASIIDAAVPPSKPTSPRPRRDTAVGAFLGLALGFAVALSMDALDRTIREESVAGEVFDAPVLCSIPRQRRIATEPLVALKPGGSPTGEAYRALRTAIRFRESSHHLKTVLVTSAAAGDGKSTIAANLAIAMSLDGANTILIDADLRRSRLAEMFDLPAGKGLTDVLLGKASLPDALVEWRRGLRILQVGDDALNPSEALGSEPMKKLLEDAKRIADIVIIDAPPILPVADPAVLAALVDGTVLVCRWRRTSLHAASSTRSMLENVGAEVIGVVLNAEGGGRSANYYRHYSTRPPRRREQRVMIEQPGAANGSNGASAESPSKSRVTPPDGG